MAPTAGRALALALLCLAAACQWQAALAQEADDTPTPGADDPPGSLHKALAEQAPLFRSLIDVIGLAPDNISANAVATVFAPNDTALKTFLERMSLSIEELQSKPELIDLIVSYHIVPGIRIENASVVANGSRQVATGDSNYILKLTKGPNGTLALEDVQGNTAAITSKAPTASGKINVHTIDNVLLSGNYFYNVSAALRHYPTWVTTAGVARQVGLLKDLSAGEPFTLLVPSSRAWKPIEAQAAAAEPSAVSSLLKYHILPGTYQIPIELASGRLETMVPGHAINSSVKANATVMNRFKEAEETQPEVRLIPEVGDPANVTTFNVYAGHNMVHGISGVLRPSLPETASIAPSLTPIAASFANATLANATNATAASNTTAAGARLNATTANATAAASAVKLNGAAANATVAAGAAAATAASVPAANATTRLNGTGSAAAGGQSANATKPAAKPAASAGAPGGEPALPSDATTDTTAGALAALASSAAGSKSAGASGAAAKGAQPSNSSSKTTKGLASAKAGSKTTKPGSKTTGTTAKSTKSTKPASSKSSTATAGAAAGSSAGPVGRRLLGWLRTLQPAQPAQPAQPVQEVAQVGYVQTTPRATAAHQASEALAAAAGAIPVEYVNRFGTLPAPNAADGCLNCQAWAAAPGTSGGDRLKALSAAANTTLGAAAKAGGATATATTRGSGPAPPAAAAAPEEDAEDDVPEDDQGAGAAGAAAARPSAGAAAASASTKAPKVAGR